MTPDKKCVDRCSRKGSKCGLWVDRHVYVFEPQNKTARYAAMDVSVTGTLRGETIHVDSIAPNKRAANSKTKNYISRSLTPVSSLPVSLPLSAPERFRPLHPKRSSTTSDRRGQHQS